MIAETLIALQLLLTLCFCFFGYYNILYGIACFFPHRIKRVPHSDGKVAVVIVCYNERTVIADTIKAAEKLTYPNKVIIVGDDSNDGRTFPLLRQIARAKGCVQTRHGENEVWESPDFVIFHRPHNKGFKGGHLHELEPYLQAKRFDYMYLLDADWWPQHDAVERCMEVIEADSRVAFVQTRRHSYHARMSFLQRCLAMNEDGTSFVDLSGRQAVGDPILFGGCSALFRLKHVYAAEGFTPGHLTEDADLTNKFYLRGYKGVYLDTVANEGEVPPHYHSYRKQQEHWAAGCSRAFKEYFWPILASKKLSWKEKFALLRQNAYYSTAVLINFSILLALASILLVTATGTDNYESVLYQYYLNAIALPYSIVMFVVLGSNFIHPTVTAIKRRKWENFIFIPYATWASWSILHTYFGANIQGWFHTKFNLDWFHTPKTNKKTASVKAHRAHHICLINAATLGALLWIYWMEWSLLGVLDVYAFFWVPALVAGTFLS